MKTTQRLKILTPEDISALYERPEFSDVERRHFFNLPKKLLEQLAIKKIMVGALPELSSSFYSTVILKRSISFFL